MAIQEEGKFFYMSNLKMPSEMYENSCTSNVTNNACEAVSCSLIFCTTFSSKVGRQSETFGKEKKKKNT